MSLCYIHSNQASNLSLNPCCNGIYSMSVLSLTDEASSFGLNPCCNGIYSMREKKLEEYENN